MLFAAGKALGDSSIPLRERPERAKEWAAAGVMLLRTAERNGAFRDRTERLRLIRESDWAPLAARDDFRALLRDVEFPTEPFVSGSSK